MKEVSPLFFRQKLVISKLIVDWIGHNFKKKEERYMTNMKATNKKGDQLSHTLT